MDEKIRGHFTLDHAPADKDLVMISTGTGIAPFISMLRAFRGKSRWRRLVIIHGVRRVNELGYRQELEEAIRSDPTVSYIPVVSREPADSDWPGLRGRVQLALADETYQDVVGAVLEPAQCHVFLCGNPEMIKSVQAMLEERGFRVHNKKNPGNIHFERYW
jgi:ferredoxin--NADP+ reductase